MEVKRKKPKLVIKGNTITGIYIKSSFDILKILKKKYKKISFLPRELENFFYTENVNDEFLLSIEKYNYSHKEKAEKLNSFLSLIDFDEAYLKRSIASLAKSEKKLLALSLALTIDSNIYILDEPFLYLDNKNTNKVKKIITLLKNKHNKTIVLLSTNTEILFELCEEIVLVEKNEIILSGSNSFVFEKIKQFKDNFIPYPEILEFVNYGRKKGAELNYNRTINSLVKDVCENVE